MLRAQAHVNYGRWIARCPRPFCPNAEHFGADPKTGHVGGLTGAGFRCSHCDLVCGADWPPNVDDIEYLLSLRPVPSTRNWDPGETIHDLLAENARHGVHPPLDVDPAALPAGVPVLAIAGEHITVGRELVAASRRAIRGGL